MTTENARLDAAENLVDLKAVEGAIVEKMGEFKEGMEKLNGEFEAFGEVQSETKGSVEQIVEKQGELHDRLQTIEQKGIHIAENAIEDSLGAQFVKCDNFKEMVERGGKSARMIVKTAIINAQGQNQPLVASDRTAGIATTPNRVLTIRDILPRTTTSSNLIEFTRENAFTNNAAAQGTGSSPLVVENTAKAESANTFTLQTEEVVTLAHFIPASKQVLSDSAMLQGHINGRLMYGLKLAEEDQLLNGAGAGHALNGLITVGTAATGESPAITNELDIIRSAIKQANIGEYRPNFLVLNPQDWFDIEIRKVGSSDDRYVIGNPGSLMGPTLWGLPVIVTNSVAAGTFLVGDTNGAEIYDREQASVETSREHSTNFTLNMVTILAEERLALVTYRTEAFVTGSL